MSAPDLASRKCEPCTGKTPPVPPARARELLAQVPGWHLADGGTAITRSWVVADFAEAIDFFRRVAAVAEAEDHHPDLHLTKYRDVAVGLTTHAIGALSENDFIVAAKINALGPPRLKG